MWYIFFSEQRPYRRAGFCLYVNTRIFCCCCCLNFEHTILESNNDKNDTNIAVCDDNDKNDGIFRTISSGWISCIKRHGREFITIHSI